MSSILWFPGAQMYLMYVEHQLEMGLATVWWYIGSHEKKNYQKLLGNRKERLTDIESITPVGTFIQH